MIALVPLIAWSFDLLFGWCVFKAYGLPAAICVMAVYEVFSCAVGEGLQS